MHNEWSYGAHRPPFDTKILKNPLKIHRVTSLCAVFEVFEVQICAGAETRGLKMAFLVKIP